MRQPATVAEARRPVPVPQKLRLGAEILRSYLRVRWLLRRKDLSEVVAILRLSHRQEEDRVDTRLAQVIGARLGYAVLRTLAILPTDKRCLIRSLVLTDLLARRGIRSTVVIGVSSASEFSAHAWVEKDGEQLLSSEEDVYQRLVEL